jgi:arylsulfatase A-like enzyme
VPGIIEWPAAIKPRITKYPASTMDIFPTIADILGLDKSVLLEPVDGVSLRPLFEKDIARREKPIPFRFHTRGALVDNDHKLVATNIRKQQFELFDLVKDPKESTNISKDSPEIFERMKAAFMKWNATVDASVAGMDYPKGKVRDDEPKSHFWTEDERYKPYFEKWKTRPEYAGRLKKRTKGRKKKK